MARFLNRGWAVLAGSGWAPKRLSRLEVTGRRSGAVVSFPVVVADFEGQDYLVSMLGRQANWVRNVRAADGRAVLRHGRRQKIALHELPPDERAPILRRYLEVAPGARAHVAVDRHASLDEFERVAPQYPVFKITRESGPANSPACDV
jgi:deazaflavin-dependent oxidoreductase (nitroreductase family)